MTNTMPGFLIYRPGPCSTTTRSRTTSRGARASGRSPGAPGASGWTPIRRPHCLTRWRRPPRALAVFVGLFALEVPASQKGTLPPAL